MKVIESKPQKPVFKPAAKKEGFKPKPNNNNGKKPFNKNQNKNFQPKKVVASKIKKQHCLKNMSVENYPDKRMYRLSIIFGSSVICDTFVIDGPFVTSVVAFRDKLLSSYKDLTNLLNQTVASGMLPRPYTKILENTHEGVLKGENNDIIHMLTRRAYTPVENVEGLEFPSIISFPIQPGSPVKGVTKRITVRINYVKNPNFSLKKKAKKPDEVKKVKPRKIVVVKKNK